MNHFAFRSVAPVWLGLAATLCIAGGVQAKAADVEVGQPAPAFALPDETGRVRSLDEFKGKTLILAFYPKDFTGG